MGHSSRHRQRRDPHSLLLPWREPGGQLLPLAGSAMEVGGVGTGGGGAKGGNGNGHGTGNGKKRARV